MRVRIFTRAEIPVLVGRIEARSIDEAQRLVGNGVECRADTRDMPLASFLRRIPRAKRNAMRVARTTDANLNDALDLIYTYNEVSVDDQNVIDFANFLFTNGNLTAPEAQALLV